MSQRKHSATVMRPACPPPSVSNAGLSSLGFALQGPEGRVQSKKPQRQKPNPWGAERPALAVVGPLAKPPLSTGHSELDHPRMNKLGAGLTNWNAGLALLSVLDLGHVMCSYSTHRMKDLETTAQVKFIYNGRPAHPALSTRGTRWQSHRSWPLHRSRLFPPWS